MRETAFVCLLQEKICYICTCVLLVQKAYVRLRRTETSKSFCSQHLRSILGAKRYPRHPGSIVGGSPGEGADFWTIFKRVLRSIARPFGTLGDPGEPQSRHFSAPGAPFCSPGAASETPRRKDLHCSSFEVSKNKFWRVAVVRIYSK